MEMQELKAWMVAKTSLGTALLLRADQGEKCLPIYLGSQGAYPILQAMEGKKTRGTTELFLQVAQEEKLILQQIEIREKEKNLESLLYIEERSPIPMSLLDSLLLAIRGEIPITAQKELFDSRGILINLQDSTTQKKLQELEEKLNLAVQREDYEKAAQLRDQIQLIQKEQQPTGGA